MDSSDILNKIINVRISEPGENKDSLCTSDDEDNVVPSAKQNVGDDENGEEEEGKNEEEEEDDDDDGWITAENISQVCWSRKREHGR